MANIESSYIQIFPLAKPRATNLSNRLFYEENVAAIIRQITSGKSFIVDADTEANRATAVVDSTAKNIITISGNANITYPLEFNIYGYRIQIKNGASVVIDSNTHKYLIGRLKLNIPEDANLTEVNGQDINGEYSGFEIYSSDSLPSDTKDTKNLVLFEKSTSSENYTLYKKSLQLFTAKSIDITGMITGIDGKR